MNVQAARRVFASILLALCAAPSVALAHEDGRFPQSSRVIEDPSDPTRLWVASTFGLLTTSDRGAGWQYLCAHHFAKEHAEGDPLLEYAGGSVFSGLSAMLNRSANCGCDWETVAAAAEDENVQDLALDASGALLLLSYRVVSGAYVFRLSASPDFGASWELRGEIAAPSYVTSLEVAPSDPMRVYVAGYDATGQGQLAVSSDGGVSWEPRSITMASVDSQPFVAAVHPTNPDDVFVRLQNVTPEGLQQDSLLRSTDAGVSWNVLMQQPAALLAFAISPDAQRMMVGYGDRMEPGYFSEPLALGIYRAPLEQQPSFEKVLDGSVSCLSWTASGLYVCLAEQQPDVPSPFAVGFAATTDFTLADEAPLTPLLRYADVQGPASCAEPSCPDNWPVTCAIIGANCEAPPAPLLCAGAALDTPLPDNGVPDDGGAPAEPPPAPEASNCVCSLPHPTHQAPGWAVLGVFAAAGAWQRRRARRDSTSTRR